MAAVSSGSRAKVFSFNKAASPGSLTFPCAHTAIFAAFGFSEQEVATY
jgi:hypothetical protein